MRKALLLHMYRAVTAEVADNLQTYQETMEVGLYISFIQQVADSQLKYLSNS